MKTTFRVTFKNYSMTELHKVVAVKLHTDITR